MIITCCRAEPQNFCDHSAIHVPLILALSIFHAHYRHKIYDARRY